MSDNKIPVQKVLTDFATELGTRIRQFTLDMKKEVEKAKGEAKEAKLKRRNWLQRLIGDSTNFLQNLPQGKLRSYIAKEKFINELVESTINEVGILNEVLNEDIDSIVQDFKADASVIFGKFQKILNDPAVSYPVAGQSKQAAPTPTPTPTPDEEEEEPAPDSPVEELPDDEIEKIQANAEKRNTEVEKRKSGSTKTNVNRSELVGTRDSKEEEEELVDEVEEALKEFDKLSNDQRSGALLVFGKNEFKPVKKKITDEDISKFDEDSVDHLLYTIMQLAQEQEEAGITLSILKEIKNKYKKDIDKSKSKPEPEPEPEAKANKADTSAVDEPKTGLSPEEAKKRSAEYEKERKAKYDKGWRPPRTDDEVDSYIKDPSLPRPAEKKDPKEGRPGGKLKKSSEKDLEAREKQKAKPSAPLSPEARKSSKAPKTSSKASGASSASEGPDEELSPQEAPESQPKPQIPRPQLPKSAQTPDGFATWIRTLARKLQSELKQSNPQAWNILRTTVSSAKNELERGASINPQAMWNSTLDAAGNYMDKEELYKMINSTSGFN